jgi:hypothetical protein
LRACAQVAPGSQIEVALKSCLYGQTLLQAFNLSAEV